MEVALHSCAPKTGVCRVGGLVRVQRTGISIPCSSGCSYRAPKKGNHLQNRLMRLPCAALAFKFISGFGEAVEAAPDEQLEVARCAVPLYACAGLGRSLRGQPSGDGFLRIERRHSLTAIIFLGCCETVICNRFIMNMLAMASQLHRI